MSVYISCPYDCRQKDTARNVFTALNNVGLKTFYNGDIPEDRRIDTYLADPIVAAIVQSSVFIPILCKEFGEDDNFGINELAMAIARQKLIYPISVQPGFVPTGNFGRLLDGHYVTDLSPERELQEQLSMVVASVQALLAGQHH